MTGLCWPLLALAAAGAAFGLWQWFQRRRTLRRLGDMLDRAIAGGFAEERFDETELSALEGKLARFLRGSAHAQKTLEGEQAAVKALVADISHQTRTPISNLLLYASLLLESDLPPQQREQARAVMAQGEKLSFLIKALVKASRLETGIVVPVPSLHSVGVLLEDVAQQEEQAAQEKGIALRVLPFDGAAAFDPRWTSEALGNVVNNAVKYTPAGGTVTLCAQMLDGFCRVDVADSGPGIPEAEQGEIFNRFYRGAGTRTAEGLGLGLYLARQILTLQGGYIKVSSTPGNGSTFSLYLPRELNRI
ncbi:MAG TPA: HAMP domain-containing histidine kinase [Candidatus Gemmiger stercoripullorum]|nr:HAMP domain-containing histidine kinase [Candidatus Gemmiger stercoripullorum]